MKKRLAFFMAALMCVSNLLWTQIDYAKAEELVNTEEELLTAIANKQAEIVLAKDIELSRTIELNHYNGTIKAQGHKISTTQALTDLFRINGGQVEFKQVVLDGNQQARLLKLREGAVVTINENSELINGSSKNDTVNAEGGALYVNGSTLNVANSVIKNGKSIKNAAVNEQESKSHGGAIYGYNSTINLDTVTLEANAVADSGVGMGGAIYVDKGKVDIKGGKFINNKLNSKSIVTGGNIYVGDGGELTINKNAAGEKTSFDIVGPFNTGGAIRLLGATATVNDADFIVNAQNADGYATSAAAIMSEGSSLTVNNSNFSHQADSKAKLDYAGGFIAIVGEIKKCEIKNSNFAGRGQGNGLSTATYGGAICFESDDHEPANANDTNAHRTAKYTYGDAVIDGCKFNNFSADQWGGTIALSTKAGERNGVNLVIQNSTISNSQTLFWGKQYGGAIAVGPGNTLKLVNTTIINARANDGGGIYNQGKTEITGGSQLTQLWGITLGGAVYNDGELIVDEATISGNDAGRGATWMARGNVGTKQNSKSEYPGINIYAHKDVTITPKAKFDDGDVRVLDKVSSIILTGALGNKINVSVSEYEKKAATPLKDGYNTPELFQGEDMHRYVGYLIAKGDGNYEPTAEDAKFLNYISYDKQDSDPNKANTPAEQYQPAAPYADHTSIGMWDAIWDKVNKTVVLGQRVKLTYHANANGIDDASQANFPAEDNAATVAEIKDVYKSVIPWAELDSHPEAVRSDFKFVDWYKRAVTDADVQEDATRDIMSDLVNVDGEITKIIDPNEIDTYAGWRSGIKVKKVWEGLGLFYEVPSVTIKLYADGVEVENKTLVLGRYNNYEGLFENLPKYRADGKTEIVYTIDEIPVEGYDKKITGDMASGFVVTNTKQPDPTTTETTTETTPTTEPTTSDSETTTTTTEATTTEATTTATTTEATTTTEPTTEATTTETTTEATTTVEPTESTTTPTTAEEKVVIKVRKAWEGVGAEESKPAVTVKLLIDGSESEQTLVLNQDNGYTGTFENLPKYHENSTKEVAYTVDEVAVKGFTKKISGNAAEGFVITNTKDTPIYGDILVKKQNANEFSTTHDSTYKVEAGDIVTFRSTIDASLVKGQIEAEKNKFGAALVERFKYSIQLTNMEFEFVTKIIPAPGLIFPDPSTEEGKSKYSFGPEPFKLKDVVKNADGTISVYMDIDKEKVKTFGALYNELVEQKKLDCLILNVEGVKVPDDAQEGTLYTSKGEISGKFKTKASYWFFSQEMGPYKWEATQDVEIPETNEDGTDSLLANADAKAKEVIQGTLEVAAKPTTTTTTEPTTEATTTVEATTTATTTEATTTVTTTTEPTTTATTTEEPTTTATTTEATTTATTTTEPTTTATTTVEPTTTVTTTEATTTATTTTEPTTTATTTVATTTTPVSTTTKAPTTTTTTVPTKPVVPSLTSRPTWPVMTWETTPTTTVIKHKPVNKTGETSATQPLATVAILMLLTGAAIVVNKRRIEE